MQRTLSLVLLLLISASVSAQQAPPGNDEEAGARAAWEVARQRDPSTGRIPPSMRMRELMYASTLPGQNLLSAAGQKAGAAWDFRGPVNVGGRTRAFAIDVTDENVLLAGGVSGGLWRSADAGASWTRVTPAAVHPGVNAIAQDTRPGHTDTWYYLSGEAYGTSASGGKAFYLGNGMYKSTDGGMTWSSLPSTVSGTPQSFDNVWDVTWNVVTDASDTVNDRLYACMYSTLYRSTNGGTTWTLLRGGINSQPFSYFTDVAVSPTGVLFTTFSSDGVNKGIFRSPTGNPGTLTDITPPNFPANYDRLKIEIDPNDENTVYFFGPTPGSGMSSVNFLGDVEWNSLWKYQYVSGNGSGAGGTWTDLSMNLPGYISQFGNLNTQGGYDLVLDVKPGSPNVLFFGGTNLFRSTSALADSVSTQQVGGYAFGASLPFVDEYPGHHPDQHGLAFLPSNPDVMYSVCDGGVSRTMDNTAYPMVLTELNTGYITSQFYTVAVDHSSMDDIVIGGLQDNGTYFTNTTSNAAPWIHTIDGDGSYCAIADGGSTYYFSKQLGKMVKATVDTATGLIANYRRFDPIGASDYQFINPFVVDPNDNSLMYLIAGRCIWRNDDLSGIALTNQYDSISTNWTQFTDSITNVVEEFTAIGVSTVPANRIYVGTNFKNLYRIDNANTGNPSRTTITSTLFPSGSNTSCIAVDPTDADRVLVVFSNYSVYSMFYTSDGGTTWAKVAGNLEQSSNGSGNGPSCRWAAILPVSDGTVYLVGTSTGLYATDTLVDNGTVWVQQAPATIGSAVIDMIDVRTTDGLVAVCTHGSGMYSTHITSVNDITSIRESEVPVIDLLLYPNPARDEVMVEFRGFSAGRSLQVEVFGESGLSASAPHALIAGKAHRLPVGHLAAGLYYVRVTAGEQVVTRSLAVTR